MKKTWTVFLMFGMLAFCNPAFAVSSSVERQTVLNNVTDYLATVGKPAQDKKEIVQERQDIRREARIKKEDRRKRAETRKRMKAQEEAMMRKITAQSN